ncbi:hypothetical protein JXJ21_26215 [candidate division KSB1 bacterium]|nr:hypothetical protein [candidate division KSB1 bacterium]
MNCSKKISRCITLFYLIAGFVLCGTALPQAVIIHHQDTSAPAGFGVTCLQKALEAKKLQATLVRHSALPKQAAGLIEILTAGQTGNVQWDSAESWRIQVISRGTPPHLAVSGSDPVGLMYGIFELAEQIEMQPENGVAVLEKIAARSGKPALEIRADNPFLTIETDGSISPWFYDETFWKSYFSTLARNRFNVCDIHAMYVLHETSFPNLFPYFFKNPDIPEASLASEDQHRNLAMLNQIIDLAEERGVHVALMNYSMDFPGISFGDEQKLIEQTSWCVSEVLKQCPRLWMFGFRIGESGKSEKFFEVSFLNGIENSQKENVRLYTRTWLAEFKDLAKIGMKYPDNFYIEIKYNGEHLGAPYHAIQGRWGSYSYEKYLNYPRYWKIIWQIRANGTHRIFPWCDPELARRTVRSSSFADAVGFTLEPITAYYTQDPRRIFKEPQKAGAFRFMADRYWAWYMVWGRLSYDLDTSDEVFIHQFKQRFGAEAGAQVFQLLSTASRIVPLIYRHHCLGPDHRNMAPEFESGNNSRHNVDPPQISNIEQYITAGVLDRQNYLSCADYVDAYLANALRGQVTPLEAAQRLEGLAEECRDLHEAVQVSRAKTEWAILSADVSALCNLAEYYAAKTRAAMALQFYAKIRDVSRVAEARQNMDRAIAAWKALVRVTGAQYRPLLDQLRMGRQFTWANILPELEADSKYIAAIQAEIAAPAEPIFGHVPRFYAPANTNLKLTVGVAGMKSPQVLLHYRIGKGNSVTRSCSISKGGTFRATIPADELPEGVRLRYWFTLNAGESFCLPEAGEHQPYEVQITNDQQMPHVELAAAVQQANSLKIECKITDQGGIADARVEWKPMPSDQPWAESISMTAMGENIFAATVPLTYEGLLYAIVARDNSGNTVRYPDVRTATPYLVVNPWDRGLAPELKLVTPGQLSENLTRQAIQWNSVSKMGRPGLFYEYSGKNGRIDFPFSIDTLSDYNLTVALVMERSYGRASVLVDDQPVGILNGDQDVGACVPVQREFYVPLLAAGEHTLSFVLLDDRKIGLEGFRFTPRSAMVDKFLLSQSFAGFIGEAGKDKYPIGDPQVRWTQAKVDTQAVVHLDAQLLPNEDCYAFAATELACSKPLDTYLLVGSNDGCFVWLNGTLVHSNPGKRFYRYNNDRIPVHLQQGKNLLVLLIMQAGRMWMFNVNLESYDFVTRLPKF